MNILIFSWRGLGHPNAGGAEVSTHEHAKGWVKAGHSVTLFTSYFPDAKREEVVDGIEIKRYGRQMFGVQWEGFVWYLFKPHRKFDLVIDQFHGIPFFTPFYIRCRKLAFIHEVAKEVWSLNSWPKPYNFFPSTIGRLLEPLIFLFYKSVPFMTVSKSTKHDLIEWGISDKNITIIHNGVNIPKGINRFEKEKEQTLIFLGALSKDKGIEDALKIFSILNNIDDNFQFWIVGKGEFNYLKSLKLQTIKLRINKKVKFWGYVSEEKKFELLEKAHILVNPSVREGWGLVVIEAASVGTPTVGYNTAGLRDSILNDKTGILCSANPNACSEAILSLIRDEEKYQIFRRNCFKWSKEFNWEKSSKESLELIEKLINI